MVYKIFLVPSLCNEIATLLSIELLLSYVYSLNAVMDLALTKKIECIMRYTSSC